MRMLFLVALILIGSVSTISAQTSWWRTYGGMSSDDGSSVRQTTDGGYIIAGSTLGIESQDVYLIKTNASGDTLWTRTHGGAGLDRGNSVQQTTDSGYIIAGTTGSFGAGSYDAYLIKTDSSGDTLWTRTYGGTNREDGRSVQQTTDGGYVIAGSTQSFGAGSADVYLIKTNASGDSLWTRTYGGTNADVGCSVQQTTDSGYIVTGHYGIGTLFGDVYLIKTNASGDTLWTRTYGGADAWGQSVQQTTDGGYIITGYTVDVYLIKTTAAGDTLWTRTYGGPGEDEGYSVRQTTDGGYIITGLTGSFGAGEYDVYVIKTNASGDTLWTRTYGGTGYDRGSSVEQTSDGGCIITGSSSGDVYLIKTDSLGSVGVAEESPKPRVMRGRLGTTVLSGASGVRQLASCVAFDAMGRRVHHPEPGIYFLRTESSAAPRKVLLVE